MALTAEQQAQVDVQAGIEDRRHLNQMGLQGKLTRIETVRVARDILLENRRLDTASDTSDITAANVVSFATEVEAYINS